MDPITAAIISTLVSAGASEAVQHQKNVKNTSGPTQAGPDGMIHFDPDEAQQVN